MGCLQEEVSIIKIEFTKLSYSSSIFIHTNYHFRFDEMVRWMDHVDSNLRTILHEVNTLEEFETEKTIFQVRNIFIHFHF